ncbi:uncharacterized protein B0T15DRAFT_529749 [Chaetomium strumarium]|uniref:FAD-binding PCMH-type domain-containing protein n=1 Tax=Chaetomium strumarium TaxID=1170767 RepID=A0AAJ0GWE9_9PEZI|nr:hypothetical protein B0T15DRAFT_529749 [Chaetomium strumarium]
MLFHASHGLWALTAWLASASALPTLQTSSGQELVNLLERAANPELDIAVSPKASILHPGDAGFAEDTQRWSERDAPTFKVAFFPATEKDVAIGLKYMTSHNVSFLAASGSKGFSKTLASVQGGVNLNLKNFDKVTYDKAKKTMTVGGGAKFQQLWTLAYNEKRELPLSSACVGVGGCTVGGGHGWLQGKYGLVIDAVLSMRVALWDGTIVTASETQNSDLFWAMRGAGQNFGIMLEFTMKTWPQTNGGMFYNADMSFTSDSLEGVVGVINDIIPTQPADLGIDFVIFTNATTNQTQLYLGFVYLGDAEKGKELAARFADSKQKGIQRTLFNESMARWDQLSDVVVGGFIDQACSGGSNQQVDVYTANTKQIDAGQARRIWDSYDDFVAKHPGAARSTVLWEVFAQQALRNPPGGADRTAYAGRDTATVLVLVQGIYNDAALGPDVDAWARPWRDEITSTSGYPRQTIYMNYAHGDEPLEAMYGYEPWRLDRLRRLKAKYDPHGHFNHYNSVLGITKQGY